MTAIFLSSPSPKAEFIVYAFQQDELSKGSPVWQAHKFLDDEDEALRVADALFAARKFTRVEVRQKGNDTPIKICDTRPSSLRRLYLMLFGAAFCIVSAGLITLYQ